MRIKTWVAPADWRLVASYYGKKDKAQKAAIVRDFKEGTKRMIVATKAFGMGVDISDIDRVYHVAPSSTFVDYIQEIGSNPNSFSQQLVPAGFLRKHGRYGNFYPVVSLT